MAFDYDGLYRKEPHALGRPATAFVDFFRTYRKKAGRVLDIGCGQGRDALMIAAYGHHVVGVDISPAGIACMTAEAVRRNLNVNGHVADIRTFEPEQTFDVILFDRTLHMLSRTDRLDVLARLCTRVADAGHLLIADEKSNMPGFRQLLSKGEPHWVTENDSGGLLFLSRAE